MYALLVFILLFAIVLITGAALAYPTHTLLGLWMEPDFEQVANRAVLGLGILMLLVLFRKFGFRSWQDIGFPAKGTQIWKDTLNGFGAGLLIMGPIVAGLLHDAFAFLYSPALMFDSFIALFAAGLLLALIRLRTGRLAVCIGHTPAGCSPSSFSNE